MKARTFRRSIGLREVAEQEVPLDSEGPTGLQTEEEVSEEQEVAAPRQTSSESPKVGGRLYLFRQR